MLEIMHERIQWPVGQGFFHTGSFYQRNDLKLTYVYDCGSSAPRMVNRAVDDFADMIAERPVVDLLFVSHLHKDHVVGLKRLREKLNIKRVVLPMFDMVDRAIAIGGMEGAPTEDVAAYIENPGGFIAGGRGETTVYEMEPNGEEPPREPDTPEREGQGAWDFDGFPAKGGKSPIKNGQVFKPQGGAGWIFLPYCMRDVDQRQKFQDCVKTALGKNISDLSTDDLLNNRATLKSCYKAIGSLHTSNLFALSCRGKSTKHETESRILHGRYGCHDCRMGLCPWQKWPKKIGWLGTGDGEIKKHYQNTLRFYRRYLDTIGTVTLPHHGSRNNISPMALQRIDAENAVVSYGKNSYGHPSPGVIASCRRLDFNVFAVTDQPSSAFIEIIDIYK